MATCQFKNSAAMLYKRRAMSEVVILSCVIAMSSEIYRLDMSLSGDQ